MFGKASSPTKIKYILFTTEWALKTFFSGTAKHNKDLKNIGKKHKISLNIVKYNLDHENKSSAYQLMYRVVPRK